MENDLWLKSLPEKRQVEMLERHAAFWRREPGSPALIGFAPRSRVFPLQNLDLQHEGSLHPEDVTGPMIQADLSYSPPIDPKDDLFPGKIPLEPLPWAEGYCGSNVFLSTSSRTVWTKPNYSDSTDPLTIKLTAQPNWLSALVRATKENVAGLGSEYLISESLLRGPADCLEALIGSTRLCYNLYDEPERVLNDMDWLADRIIELAKVQSAAIPRFHGGTINRYRVWAPGENIVTQADIATLLSPDLFGTLLLPAYRKIARAFETVTIHFHSSGAQHAGALMSVGEIAAIEWGMDPTGSTLQDMLPIFTDVLREKSLILMNIETEEEMDLLLTTLPHEGLCIIRRKDYGEPSQAQTAVRH